MTQPSTWWYPIHPTLDDPNITAYLSAADAKAKGVPQDKYRTSRNLKLWTVSAAYAAANADKNGNLTFNVFDPALAANAAVAKAGTGGLGVESTITMSIDEATSINYPSAFYEPYTSPATDATLTWLLGGGTVPADPNQMCLLADAQAMAAQIQALYPGQTATVVQLVSNLYRLNYGQVPTRQWYIQIAGNTFLAQALILASKSQGDGAPGHFILVGPNPQWVFDRPPDQAPPNEATWPTPIRATLPNEVIANAIPGLQPGSKPFPGTSMQWIILRTDVQPPALPAQPATGDSAALAQIYADTQAIRASMHV